jgi:beta-N-acetylhexosaminidase
MRRAAVVALATAGVVLTPVPTNARPEPFAPRSVLTQSPHAVAVAAYARMTQAQRVGQLFMAGVPSDGPTSTRLASLHRLAVGSVVLDGDDSAGRHAVRTVTRPVVTKLRSAGVAPFVSTDQEGGEVQRLSGPGFARIPSALVQGKMSPAALRAASTTWAQQLRRAGVSLNLAPVADAVPAKHARANQPIGHTDREYGHTPAQVAPHVVAVVHGMRDAQVATTVKHFPGLGRATGDTDTKHRVTDPTSRHDPYLRPFRAAIRAGAPFVMVSSATYPNIDPSQAACFSPTILTSMLRDDLGFRGVVISDDLAAASLHSRSPRQRALRFLRAGGTMLLDTTPRQVTAMVHAVRDAVAAHPGFARTVKAAVMTDLIAKARAGLAAS